MYSQTWDQQPPKANDKSGCLRQVAADHKIHYLVGFFLNCLFKLNFDKTFMWKKRLNVEFMIIKVDKSMYEQFPHFQQCFQKSASADKCIIMYLGVI